MYINFQSWNDYNLRWNPEEFGNITSIRILSTKIWIPGMCFICWVEKFSKTLKFNRSFAL